MNRSIHGGPVSRATRVLHILPRDAFRKSAFLCALALTAAQPAFAQTSVDNVTRVVNPSGVACSDVGYGSWRDPYRNGS